MTSTPDLLDEVPSRHALPAAAPRPGSLARPSPLCGKAMRRASAHFVRSSVRPPGMGCALRSATPPGTERPAQPLTVEDRPITGLRHTHSHAHSHSGSPRIAPAFFSLGRVAGQRRSKSTGAPGDLYVYADGRLATLMLVAPHALARSHHPLRTGPTSCCASPLGDLIQGHSKHGGQTGAAKPSADSDHAAPLWQSAPHEDWVSIRPSAVSLR
jgi:hypothetical protein